MSLPWLRSRRLLIAAAATLSGGLIVGVAPLAFADTPDDRAAQFSYAADEFGVPTEVLLGVSYMESRWRDHAGEYSTAGGYGPMHLTDAEAVIAAEGGGSHHDGSDARGDANRPMTAPEQDSAPKVEEAGYSTLPAAAELLGVEDQELRDDPYQNIRGGAALLASYQDDAAESGDDPSEWYGAVARYSQSQEQGTARRFADQVFELISSGASENTDDGAVRLEARKVEPQESQLKSLELRDVGDKAECPVLLGCEWIPAPYEQYGETAEEYGNHDKADRGSDGMDIDYIVIHDTETSYSNTIDLVQDPEYVSWQYTLRSFDGHIAQHVKQSDVAWQAGNWTMNTRSVGLEHEGVAAEGSWFTEEMYRSSAELVKYLSDSYDIPLDRQHIVGHDNVPAPAADGVADMHWDTGPFWDWEHYFDLLGEPLPEAESGEYTAGDTVQISPSYETNQVEYVGCDVSNPESSCGERSSSAVLLHSEPSEDSPLLNDPGMEPDGTPATNRVNDVGSRASAGQNFVVADQEDEWVAVWYLGQRGWIHNSEDNPVLAPVESDKVAPAADGVQAYGLTLPEESAYDGTDVPVQDLAPLPYALDADQEYTTSGTLDSQYFYAKEFEEPGVIVDGEREYFQVQVGGRVMYVDAEDVNPVE